MALGGAEASRLPGAPARAGLSRITLSQINDGARGIFRALSKSASQENSAAGADGEGTTGWRLALIVLSASLLRIVGLGKESIWLDEATSLVIARMNLPSVVAWAAGDIHPPLYYLTLHFWLVLGDSEFAVRALSAVLGIVAIVATYALANELFGGRVGLLAAALLALAPLHIWYSQQARMYVMVTVLSVLASYLLLLALRRQQTSYWLAFVLTTVLALYTHYYALFAWLFQGVFAVYWLWSNRSNMWRRWLAAQAAVAVLFTPWLPVLYHQVSTGGGGWVEKSIGRPAPYALVDTWLYFSIGLDSGLYPVLLRRAAYLLFATCLLAGILSLRRAGTGHGVTQPKRQREGVLFCIVNGALPVLTVWVLSQVKPMYSVRYLLVFLPLYCILVARGIDGLKWDRVGIAVALFLTLTLLVGNWNAWRLEQNADWRGVTLHVLAHSQPRDVVLFSPRWNEKPFEYYNRGRVDTNMDLPIPVTMDAAQRVVEDISQRYERVWLVWTSGHYSDPDGTVKQILESRYGIVQESSFRGVDRLILYDLRVAGES